MLNRTLSWALSPESVQLYLDSCVHCPKLLIQHMPGYCWRTWCECMNIPQDSEKKKAIFIFFTSIWQIQDRCSSHVIYTCEGLSAFYFQIDLEIAWNTTNRYMLFWRKAKESSVDLDFSVIRSQTDYQWYSLLQTSIWLVKTILYTEELGFCF